MISKSSDLSPLERLPARCNVDRHTLEQLLVNTEHRQRIERIARKQTRGTAISWEEAAQTAHLKLIQVVRAGKFRHGDAKAFYRWAATVARFEIIDLVRKETHQCWTSLDQTLPNSDVALVETIADDFNLLDSVERSDFVVSTIAAIASLDQQYPDRGYLKLWQGQVAGKNQSELAAELGLTQSAISKRWKELTNRLAAALGLLQPEAVQAAKSTRADRRNRSSTQW